VNFFIAVQSLHPDGYSFISASAHDVALWDLRKMSRKIASYNCGHSVVSAFFSSSGRHVVSTTLAHKLDVFENFHMNMSKPSPLASIPHKNYHVCAVQASSHPGLDLFAVGSYHEPQSIYVMDPAAAAAATGPDTGASSMYSVTGDALATVASRVAFHPRSDALILAGGDIRGNVTIVK
jgi:hypothetical protein